MCFLLQRCATSVGSQCAPPLVFKFSGNVLLDVVSDCTIDCTTAIKRVLACLHQNTGRCCTGRGRAGVIQGLQRFDGGNREAIQQHLKSKNGCIGCIRRFSGLGGSKVFCHQ